MVARYLAPGRCVRICRATKRAALPDAPAGPEASLTVAHRLTSHSFLPQLSNTALALDPAARVDDPMSSRAIAAGTRSGNEEPRCRNRRESMSAAVRGCRQGGTCTQGCYGSTCLGEPVVVCH